MLKCRPRDSAHLTTHDHHPLVPKRRHPREQVLAALRLQTGQQPPLPHTLERRTAHGRCPARTCGACPGRCPARTCACGRAFGLLCLLRDTGVPKGHGPGDTGRPPTSPPPGSPQAAGPASTPSHLVPLRGRRGPTTDGGCGQAGAPLKVTWCSAQPARPVGPRARPDPTPASPPRTCRPAPGR